MKVVPLIEREQDWIPQRLVQMQPHQFLLWTFRQRKVFALVNGTRTVGQIARMLSISSEKVTQILRELQIMRVIVQEVYGGQ